MTDRPVLTRRTALVGITALAVGTAKADTDDRQRITLGGSTFLVPKPYLFGEFMPPGTTTDGLPPRFSFAFTAPNGAPAGEGLEFPPMSHPYVLERDNGQFLVMCYRVSASGKGPLHTPPRDELANSLISTDRHVYSKEDGALVIRDRPDDDSEQRYISVIDERNKSGVEAFLTHIDNGQFYYGDVEFEKPGVITVMYIPRERHAEFGAVLAQASDILTRWKEV